MNYKMALTAVATDDITTFTVADLITGVMRAMDGPEGQSVFNLGFDGEVMSGVTVFWRIEQCDAQPGTTTSDEASAPGVSSLVFIEPGGTETPSAGSGSAEQPPSSSTEVCGQYAWGEFRCGLPPHAEGTEHGALFWDGEDDEL